jgi:hypothetical protein
MKEEKLITLHEVDLAFRNIGMPLEGLSYDITPTGFLLFK